MFFKKLVMRQNEVVGSQEEGFRLYIIEYYKPSIFFPSSLKYKAKLFVFDWRFSNNGSCKKTLVLEGDSINCRMSPMAWVDELKREKARKRVESKLMKISRIALS